MDDLNSWSDDICTIRKGEYSRVDESTILAASWQILGTNYSGYHAGIICVGIYLTGKANAKLRVDCCQGNQETTTTIPNDGAAMHVGHTKSRKEICIQDLRALESFAPID